MIEKGLFRFYFPSRNFEDQIMDRFWFKYGSTGSSYVNDLNLGT